MKWIVKIEGKPELQIKVTYYPLNNLLMFMGQYHKPKTNKWVDFYFETDSSDIDLDRIKELLFNVYNKLNKKIEHYNNLTEGFEHIKLIEIKKD